ncbi:MAG: hypothetical protein F6J93_11795 [Oscillatoria sp. SIO1A7]|nr:hypothetical protein [Oscillatoria sp. SIO1A7]
MSYSIAIFLSYDLRIYATGSGKGDWYWRAGAGMEAPPLHCITRLDLL